MAISDTVAATPSATPAPSSTPATTSESQCARRYTRESAITERERDGQPLPPTALGPGGEEHEDQRHRDRGPGDGVTRREREADRLHEGTERPAAMEEILRDPDEQLRHPQVRTHTANARHRRRHARKAATRIRSGIVHDAGSQHVERSRERSQHHVPDVVHRVVHREVDLAHEGDGRRPGGRPRPAAGRPRRTRDPSRRAAPAHAGTCDGGSSARSLEPNQRRGAPRPRTG